jgi:hypothetical protein
MMKERNETESTDKTTVLHSLVRALTATLPANKATVGALALLLGGGLTALATDNRAPEVPDSSIAAPTNNVVHFHGFGVGFQVYTWNGTDWGKAVPDATLFDDEGNVVASHFGGPRWKSNSGSQVLGVSPQAFIVDPDSIPWVLLQGVDEGGPGIFAETTFIQRVHTVGGKSPSTDGTFVGQVARVAYMADYFFYRHSNN